MNTGRYYKDLVAKRLSPNLSKNDLLEYPLLHLMMKQEQNSFSSFDDE